MRLRLLPLFLLIVAIVGCPSPAAPPAAPAELPSLRIPATIGGEFDLTTTLNAGAGAAALVVEGDNIASSITGAAESAIFYSTFLDRILGPLHDLKIPIGADVKNFEDVIVVGDQLVNAKIDFSAYDEDNDGVLEDCSGSTAAPPICFRIWFDDKRALSGVFLNSIPTEDNPGDGRIRGFSAVKIIGLLPFTESVTYDLRDPASETSEFFVGLGNEGDTFEEIPTDKADFEFLVHETLDQAGPAESAEKTIKISAEGQIRGVARWREGDDYWSGTKDTNVMDDFSEAGDFFDACALISSGIVVNGSNCVDLGIDVSGIDFLDFVTIEDLVFPTDFPETPTF